MKLKELQNILSCDQKVDVYLGVTCVCAQWEASYLYSSKFANHEIDTIRPVSNDTLEIDLIVQCEQEEFETYDSTEEDYDKLQN